MMSFLNLFLGFSVASSFASSVAFSQSPYLVAYHDENPQEIRMLTGAKLLRSLKEQTSRNEILLKQQGQMMGALQNEDVTSLWILNASIVSLAKTDVERIQKFSFIKKVIPLGRKVKLADQPQNWSPLGLADDYTYGLIKIGVPQVRAQFLGLEGRGVRVGIIDTGILLSHPDLSNRVVLFKDFINPNNKLAVDDHGHGTHVAGTIAGAATSGKSIGVAPGVDLIIAKGFNSRGNSEDSQLLLALQWMADPDGNSETDDGAHLVNNSWNTGQKVGSITPESEPFCAILNRLKALNVLAVFASGNDGPDENTVTPPGACPDSLTVGATDASDKMASFSSRGPVKWKNKTISKPDLTAPGVGVQSADLGGRYRTRSGTSMATPHVVGALALFKQAKPELSPYDLEELARKSTFDLGTPGYDHQFGHGRLDLMKGLSILKSDAQ